MYLKDIKAGKIYFNPGIRSPSPVKILCLKSVPDSDESDFDKTNIKISWLFLSGPRKGLNVSYIYNKHSSCRLQEF